MSFDLMPNSASLADSCRGDIGLPRFQVAQGASSSATSASSRSALNTLLALFASNTAFTSASSSAPMLGDSPSSPCRAMAALRADFGQWSPARSAMASRGSQASLARSFRPGMGAGLALPMASALSSAKRARRERSDSHKAGSGGAGSPRFHQRYVAADAMARCGRPGCRRSCRYRTAPWRPTR